MDMVFLGMAIGWLISATWLTGPITESDSVIILVLLIASFVARQFERE